MPDGRIVLKENRIMMVSDEMGNVPAGNTQGFGLYTSDTRFLSTYEFRLNRLEPILLSSSTDESYVATFQMINPMLEVDEGKRTIPQQVLSIRRSRFIYGGLHERIGIQNCGREPVDIEVELVFGADFLDIFEVKADSRGQVLRYLGRQRPLEVHEHGLTFIYDGLDGVTRRTEVVLHTPPSRRHDNRVAWDFHLESKETVTLLIDVIPLIDEREPALEYLYDDALLALQRSYRHWNSELTAVATTNAFLDRGLLRRSQMDLRILVEEFDTGLMPMAGIPWFSAPFGRDALITSMQTLMLNPEIARGTLRYLAAHQGKQVDLTREEEPGKILHEIRFGELANLKQIPHTPYYGSVDSTPLFLVCAVEMMDWLDDRDLFVELLPNLMSALRWIDEYGDLDHDGFVEYDERAKGGVRNQGWKDSHDSLLYPDGRPAELPAALVEVQGYVYQAKLGLSRILERFNEPQLAERLGREAAELRRHFELGFWMDREQFYAQGLDRHKAQIPSITSNPGHCLWAGICDAERAELVSERLLAPDMFSGWGIRTLSAASPHYNPMSYHNGTIWPHDNSIAAAGLRRYGRSREALRVIEGIMEAGIRMPQYRLPELFCGFKRDALFNTGPTEYLVSCNPQAWGAGAAFHLLQTGLGIVPDTTAGRVYIAPVPLPGVSSVEVRGMRIGGGRLSFRVSYNGGRPQVDIHDQPEDLQVILDEPPLYA
ncbi:MAG TPA: glycogen debranching N-terminal domain-containing protein [Candidatus Limnocylindrales bacterium]|nr:glycogen debranching N-terminal domain-containing protein [Candidatus Limnocylindrales bacterium]